MWVGRYMAHMLHFDVISGQLGTNAHTQLLCYLKQVGNEVQHMN